MGRKTTSLVFSCAKYNNKHSCHLSFMPFHHYGIYKLIYLQSKERSELYRHLGDTHQGYGGGFQIQGDQLVQVFPHFI